MEESTANVSTINDHYHLFSTYEHLRNVSFIFIVLFAVSGSALNLWLLVTILRSPQCRASFRNKVICNILVLHLIDCLLVMPLTDVVEWGQSLVTLTCEYMIFERSICIQMILVNWLLIILLTVYISQILDFDPKTMLKPLHIKIGTAALLAVPWIVPIVCTPPIGLFWTDPYSCRVRDDAVKILMSTNTVVSVAAVVVLFGVAVVLRYQRFIPGDGSSTGQVEFLSRGKPIDNPVVYFLLVVTIVICDGLYMAIVLIEDSFATINPISILHMITVIYILGESRVIMMTVPFILLPDIREKIKTW